MRMRNYQRGGIIKDAENKDKKKYDENLNALLIQFNQFKESNLGEKDIGEVKSHFRKTLLGLISLKGEIKKIDTDVVTGVKDRSAWEYYLQAEQEKGNAPWMAILDLDNFRNVNNEYGHLMGDKVLEGFGELLREIFSSPKELVARVGGEEFVVMSNDKKSLKQKLKNLNIILKNKNFEDRKGGTKLNGLTFSSGIGQMLHNESIKSFHSRVDKALYKSKKLKSGKGTIQQARSTKKYDNSGISGKIVRPINEFKDILSKIFDDLRELGNDGDVSGFISKVSEQINSLLAFSGRFDDFLKDRLTGLEKRIPYVNKLRELIKSNKRFSFAIIDFDHFKRINDTQGHPFGDEVLKSFIKELGIFLEEKNHKCYIYRLGGEEFCLISEDLDSEGMKKLLEEFKERFSKKVIELNISGQKITGENITFSGGVIDGYGYDENDVYKKADSLLYVAKKGGRNKIVSSNDNTPKRGEDLELLTG